jgi:putative transposase
MLTFMVLKQKKTSYTVSMLNEIALILSIALNVSNAKILVDIITSFLNIPTAITTRSLARYSFRSERSWFRFLSKDYNWTKARVALFAKFSHKPKDIYFLGFDETMEGKVGKSTHGIGYFYNSILQIAQRGIGFGACSLINTQTGVSYFMSLLQVVRTAEDKARTDAQKEKNKTQKKHAKARKNGEPAPAKKSSGRPLGSKNKPKDVENVVETPSFRTFKALLTLTIAEIRTTMPTINLKHIIGDNLYATLQYLNLAKSLGLFLVSKLKRNTVLCLPYEQVEIPGQAKKRGRKPTYGETIDNENPPAHTLKATKIEGDIKHEYFQFIGYAKGCFLQLKLNILIMRSTDLKTKKVSVLIFFTNDPDLTYQQIWDFYHLRFQIEFDFRDAKQHFGLSDFKNYTETNLTNFVNLSFLMVIIMKILLPEYRTKTNNEKLSINDLKTIFNARFNIRAFYIYSGNGTNSIFNSQNIDKFIPKHIINAA